MATNPALMAGSMSPTMPTAAVTAPATTRMVPRAMDSPRTTRVTPGIDLAMRCRNRMKRETPLITGVTTGNRVRPRISLRLAICWRRSRNRAPMSWFMASAICSVTAVPVFMARPTDWILPSRLSMPADICSRNLTASSEPKAFFSFTWAAALERSGNWRLISCRMGTTPLRRPLVSVKDRPSSSPASAAFMMNALYSVPASEPGMVVWSWPSTASCSFSGMLLAAATAPMFLMASAIWVPLVLNEATVCAMAPEKAVAHSMSFMSAMMGLKIP